MTVECHKQESREGRPWLFEPTSDRRATSRQRGNVGGLESRNPASRRGGCANNEQAAHGPDYPGTISDDIAGESSLPIKPVKRRLRVGHDGFHLDDQQCAMRGVKREDIHRSAFAPHRERDLDVPDPAVSSQPREEGIDQPGVGLVHESIELFATPPKSNIHVGTKRGGRPYKRSNADAVELAAIDDAIKDRESPESRATSDCRWSNRTLCARY